MRSERLLNIVKYAENLKRNLEFNRTAGVGDQGVYLLIFVTGVLHDAFCQPADAVATVSNGDNQRQLTRMVWRDSYL